MQQYKKLQKLKYQAYYLWVKESRLVKDISRINTAVSINAEKVQFLQKENKCELLLM